MHKRTLRFSVLALAVHATLAVADPAADSSYLTDVQSSRVEDATSGGVAQVNFITCLMSSMRPDALVNEGNYMARIDATKCDTQAQAEGKSSEFYTAYVNSTRASNNDPMIASIWLNDDSEGEKATIFVRLSATEAPSASNPYGEFRIDYCGRVEGSTECMMNGYLEADDTGLRYFEVEAADEDDANDTPRTKAVQLNAVGTTSGSGRMMDNDEPAFDFAYDSSLFRRKSGSDDMCFSRDASDPQTGMSVWRYGLYDSDTGARVTRNSGFPIEYTNAGVKHHGYLGYHGLWLPGGALTALSSGSTVQKVDYASAGDPTKTDYTVVRSEGKLVKLTRKVRSLREIDKVKFSTFVGHDGATLFPGATANTYYDLYWDDATSSFRATSRMSCEMNNCSQVPLPSEQQVNVAYWQTQSGVLGHSSSVGGEIFIALNGASSVMDSAAIDVIYRVEDLVYPSQMPETLYCVRDCPTSESLSSYFGGASVDSPFVAGTHNNYSPVSHGSQITYQADATAAVLRDASNQPVTFVDAEAMQQHHYGHGVRSGVLFTDLASAECSAGSGTYCETKASEQDIYYRWETGANPHSQFAAVKDDNGVFVQFDAPLQVNYSVPNEAKYGEYAGQELVLGYAGFGDLQGIPGHCVSPATNEIVACDGSEDIRHVAAFTIPFDTTQGRVISGDKTYLVKWLEREIRFAPKALSACQNAGLELPTNVALPTSAGLQNPSDPASASYIGSMPEVTGAPRVIQGEVKY